MRRHAAVLGSPIAHSLSPLLHRAAYEALGLDWIYEAVEMTPEGLPDFLDSLDDSWAGLSLTMPLKESVQPSLESIDDLAVRTQSVNTVVRRPEGWHGANTDVFGISESLRRAGVSELNTARLLGAGATGRSAIAAMSALGVESVIVCARRPEQAATVVELARSFGLRAVSADLQPTAVEEDLLVSVLPGAAAAPWADVDIAPRAALLDASYHPWPSALAAVWPGEVVANGRDMLLWQATEQVRLMTGRDAPVEAMLAALSRA